MVDRPLKGSTHRFEDGYGYGARYLTARNVPTKPASVPSMRLPPDTDRFQRMSHPTQLVRNDERAQRRHADQIRLQTSGEIGRFYVDDRTKSEKINKKTMKHRAATTSSIPTKTFTNNNKEIPHFCKSSITFGDSPRLITSSRPPDFQGSYSRPATTSHVDSWNLDRTFGSNNKRDLAAANRPQCAGVELVWTVTSNHRAALHSTSWADKLR